MDSDTEMAALGLAMHRHLDQWDKPIGKIADAEYLIRVVHGYSSNERLDEHFLELAIG